MSDIVDDYEYTISRRVYLVFTILFSCLFLISIVYRFLVPSTAPYTETILCLRITGLLLNLFGLGLFRLHPSSGKPIYASGIFLTFANFIITRGALLLQITDQGTSAIIFSMSIIYAIFMGLFTHRFLPTLLFSVFLGACFFSIFYVFPGAFFAVTAEMSERTTFLTMISGALLLTLLIATLLSQWISSILYAKIRSNRDFLKNLAYFDQETGMPNGRWLDITINESITRNKNVSIVLMGFRILGITDLNSRIGFDETNHWIVKFANLLTDRIIQWHQQQKQEMVGDFKLYRVETMTFLFWISYPEERKYLGQNAAEAMQKIVTSILEMNQYKIRLDFTGVFAIFPDDTNEPEKLQKMVLGILHQNRNSARDRFLPYNAESFLKFQKQEEILQRMAEPSFISELRAVFQPKVSIPDNTCIGFEALIRWNSPEFGNIPPNEFISLAETTHAIETITWAVLRDTDQFVSELRALGSENFRVSFNLSPVLITKEWLAHLCTWIKTHKIGKFLELEITEGVLLNTTDKIEECFFELRQTGVGFSIDDFGTGYSNLSYLQSFKAEYLKIDKRFVNDLPKNRKDADLVSTIINMASIFGMKTVCEGVERNEQLEFLQSVGCEIIQGFYFARPLEKADAVAYFRDHGNPK